MRKPAGGINCQPKALCRASHRCGKNMRYLLSDMSRFMRPGYTLARSLRSWSPHEDDLAGESVFAMAVGQSLIMPVIALEVG
jgi:hypothetical protein